MGARKIQIINVRLLILALILILKPTMSYAAGKNQVVNFDIPAKPLASALKDFARQSGLQVSLDASIVAGKNATAIKGERLPGDALSQLLSGSGLKWRYTDNGTILVEAPKSRTSILSDGSTELGTVFVQEKEDLHQQIYDEPSSTSIIGRTEMDRNGPRHVSEILQTTPGVATVTNEQNPGVAVQVRGLKDFGRVNMNIDGMRQNFQRSGHQQRNGEMFFDTEFLSMVEISKGPSSDVGGAGATGGVATFRTIEANDVIASDERIGGRLRANTGVGGWANGQEPSGSLALAARPTENTDVLLAYSQRNSSEYEPGKEGNAIRTTAGYDVPANVVNGTGQDMESILFKAGWDLTEYQRLKFTFINTEANYKESAQQNNSQAYKAYTCTKQFYIDAGYCDDFEYDPEDVYPISSTNKVKNQNYALDYQYQGNSPYIDLAAKGYFVTTKNDYEAVSQSVHTKTQTDTIGGFAKNSTYFELGEQTDMDWLFGIEGFRDTTTPSTDSTTLTGDQITAANGVTPKGNRYIISAFTSASLHYSDWLEVTPGVRYDYYRLWGVTNYQTPGKNDYYSVDVDHTQGKWLPTLGIAVTPWQPLQIFANAGLGWRPPAITETLISGAAPGHSIAVTSYPNWNLKPEETQSWEVGFNLNFDRIFTARDSFKFKLVHFNSDTENYIFLASGIGTPGANMPSLFSSMFANSLDTITFKGEELSLNYDARVWYTGLEITRMEREGDLVTTYYPAGGAPDEHYVNNWVDSSMYYPLPPEYTGALTLGTRLFSQTVDLGMQLRYTDKSGSPTGKDFETYEYIDSSWVLDLYGDWQINQDLSAGFNLKNVMDRQYIMASGDALVKTYAPGRALTAHMQWNF